MLTPLRGTLSALTLPTKRPIQLATGLDAITEDWVIRVNNAGSSVTLSTQGHVDTFVRALKADSSGVWTQLVAGGLGRLSVFAGADLVAARVPLLVGAGSATDAATGFTSADYSEMGALNGAASPVKYLVTGLPNSALPQADRHAYAYSIAVASVTGSAYLGAGSAGATQIGILGNGNLFVRLSSTDSFNSSISATTTGHICATRSDATNVTLHVNASSQTGAAAAITPASANLIVFSRVTNLSLDTTLGAYSFGWGLSAAQFLAYRTAMTTLQTAIRSAAS